MPQISPINWIFIFLFVLFLLATIMTSFNPISSKTCRYPKNKSLNKIFKW